MAGQWGTRETRRTVRVVWWNGWPPASSLAALLGTLGALAALAAALVGVAPAWRHPVARPADLPRYDVPPAETAAGIWWFDPRGAAPAPGNTPDVGTWRRDATGTDWAWSSLPETALSQRIVAGASMPPPPEWPGDPAALRVEQVVRTNGRVLGYWVWNPAVFVERPGGSHQWMPRWEWTPAGAPLLLAPVERRAAPPPAVALPGQRQ